MPFYHAGQFYLFHQRDSRNPTIFGDPFGWSLATTPDFVHFTDRGEPLRRGGGADQDQFLFAGSLYAAMTAFMPCTPATTATIPNRAGLRRC